MDKNHGENKISTYLQYYDDNCLYACSMTQKLPVDCFDWEKKCQNSPVFL